MIEDLSYYLQTLIQIKRLELIFCILVSLFIGLIIGICIVVVSTPKPNSITVAQKIRNKKERGIKKEDIENLNNLGKALNPFNE